MAGKGFTVRYKETKEPCGKAGVTDEIAQVRMQGQGSGVRAQK